MNFRCPKFSIKSEIAKSLLSSTNLCLLTFKVAAIILQLAIYCAQAIFDHYLNLWTEKKGRFEFM